MSLQSKAQYDKKLIKCPQCGGTTFHYNEEVTQTWRRTIEVDECMGVDVLDSNNADLEQADEYTPEEVLCDNCEHNVTELLKEHL